MSELPLKDDATKAAIDFLERQGYSVVKWVEFDIDDKSTYPKSNEDLFVFTKDNYQKIVFLGNSKCWWSDLPNLSDVTHWCELPQRKESK